MQSIFATTSLGMIALIGFFTAFVLIALWAYRPQNKTRLENFGSIPLREDNHD
jgi:cbb3-type cytochrome oxidase subunit 3